MQIAAAAGIRRGRRHQTSWRLFDLELDAEIVEVRRRLEVARVRKHRHDLVNAFTAVEGAAMIMARETFSPAEHSTLMAVLGSGLDHLRSLLVAGPEQEQVALSDVTRVLAGEPEWHGRLRVDVAPDLFVTGSGASVGLAGSAGEIAEAVRQLLTHVCRRAPATPVTVRANRNGDRVELWVDDRGPRLSARERRQIAEPGRRPPIGAGLVGFGRRVEPGTVDALDVAIRLAREQGGEVLVQPRPGGGQSFGFSWAAPGV